MTQAHGIPQVTILHGATSAETAHVTDDYPYGRRLRCQRREWLEHKPGHGYRFMTQTTDPRRAYEHWNAPKASTYQPWSILVQSEPVNGETFGRIGTMSADYWGLTPHAHARFTLTGALAQLTEDQRRAYAALYQRGRKHHERDWETWRELMAYMAEHRGPDGGPPSYEDMNADQACPYVNQFTYPTLRGAFLAGFDADAPPIFGAEPAELATA